MNSRAPAEAPLLPLWRRWTSPAVSRHLSRPGRPFSTDAVRPLPVSLWPGQLSGQSQALVSGRRRIAGLPGPTADDIAVAAALRAPIQRSRPAARCTPRTRETAGCWGSICASCSACIRLRHYRQFGRQWDTAGFGTSCIIKEAPPQQVLCQKTIRTIPKES